MPLSRQAIKILEELPKPVTPPPASVEAPTKSPEPEKTQAAQEIQKEPIQTEVIVVQTVAIQVIVEKSVQIEEPEPKKEEPQV